MTNPCYIHANALVIDDAGVLLRGPSRTGKSTLTRALVAQAQAQGRFARLVGDDRVALIAQNGRVFARPHPAIAGLIEARGEGILAMPHAPACAVRLVVDLVPRGGARNRRTEDRHVSVEIAGVELPRLTENALSNRVLRRILTYLHTLMIN